MGLTSSSIPASGLQPQNAPPTQVGYASNERESEIFDEGQIAAQVLFDRIALEPHRREEMIAASWRSKKYREQMTGPMPDEKELQTPQRMDDVVHQQGNSNDDHKPGPPAPYAETVADSEAHHAQSRR